MASRSPAPHASTDDVKIEQNAAAGSDATPSSSQAQAQAAPVSTYMSGTTLKKKDFDIMTSILQGIVNYRDQDGYDISKDFHRVVSKRVLPDYHALIDNPTAISTLKGKISKKQYLSFKEYVRDWALIFHNAQVYNRPSAGVYRDAIALKELVREELQKYVVDGYITAEEAEYPDLGPIPEFEDSPPPNPDEEGDEDAEPEDEDDEDEEDEEEDDDTDDDKPRKGARGRPKIRRPSTTTKREPKATDGSKEDPEGQKKRGRPPKVHTPMEARINNLLKGMRKFKNGNDLKILPFEKLPDKSVMPDYYQEIKNPIAMDLIKRKAKRKKYQSVEAALKDIELMFENAKSYNMEDSQVYKDAVDLQKEARLLAEQEKQKPDSDFVDEDGRLPLLEIIHNGEVWKVGDWIHLRNANDPTKPIVAQIYRTWQDPNGQKWINACWYYRPEWTVHRYEKHFWENEVVKTGQYRDHKVEEISDRCFVMFFTRYNKGRPRGLDPEKEVYVCEARYNEEKHKLNKIKTWASCVPDEVREKDYEMDLFDVPRKMKKLPSPIKHMLKEDAKEDDPMPKPSWGEPNAPPIVGAVHNRPRETNESPPPEPTPSPPPPEPVPVRRPTISNLPRYDSQGDVSMSGTPAAPMPSPHAPSMAGQTPYGQQFAQSRPSASPAPLTQQNSYGSHGRSPQVAPAQIPQYQPQPHYGQYAPAPTPVVQHTNPLANYSNYQSHTAPRPVAVQHHSHGNASNAYIPPRAVEVFTLAEGGNSAIPADIRAQFHHDDAGRIIFYTTPPLDIKPVSESAPELGHSLRYLADKARSKEADQKKRKAREIELEKEADEKVKRTKSNRGTAITAEPKSLANSMENYALEMDKGTDEIYKQLYGENWQEIREQDRNNLAVEQAKTFNRLKENRDFHQKRAAEKEVKITAFKWI